MKFRAILVLLIISALTAANAQRGGPPAAAVALVGGTIYASPTADPISDGVVLVENGRIAAVGTRGSVRLPPNVQTLDCSGMTIVSGLWNSHVHFLQRKWADAATLPAPELDRQLQEMLTQFGFTAVFDTWSKWENTRRLRDRIESGEIAGPRIRSTGEAMFGDSPPPNPAVWGTLGFMPLEGFQSARVRETSQALEAVQKRLDAGTDGFKMYAVMLGSGVALSDAAMRAAVTEAHRRGKPVFSHPTTTPGLLASVRAGVDVIVHTTPQSGPWDEAVVAAMKQANVALIPTLQLWRYEARNERASIRDSFVQTGVAQLRAWHRAGGAVLFGTDVGYMSEYDPADEYELMASAGMDFRAILAALTTAPTERFGVSTELGRIASGYLGDLTVLRDDPVRDVRAFTSVQYTIRGGRIIYRREP